MSLAKNQANGFNLEQIGWKYYNNIRKKAVEQEFSWSGLFISLFIAFFIVVLSASLLNFINHSIETNRNNKSLFNNRNIYYLEKRLQINLSQEQSFIKYPNIYCS